MYNTLRYIFKQSMFRISVFSCMSQYICFNCVDNYNFRYLLFDVNMSGAIKKTNIWYQSIFCCEVN